ncbi:hypothetical protein TNCV_4064231 [Trichonephila clavipes]|nr:hypothetical protein TNCV_4064231 [Trichonephila clavipes]
MAALILRGVISPAGFLNVSNEEILENMRDQKLENTFRIRYVASIANDTVIQRTFVGASQPAPRCGEVGHDKARRVVSSRTPVPGVSYANVAKKTTQANLTQTCAEHFKELEDKNAPPPTKNSPSTKETISINDFFPSTCKEKKKYFLDPLALHLKDLKVERLAKGK